MRDISLHLMDIIQNSIAAHASIVQIVLEISEDVLNITVTDNGAGMGKELLSKVESPFTTTRTTRKIGLGIPMFRQNALASGGSFAIESQEGKGTVVKAVFNLRNIDCIPLGDISETIFALVVLNPSLDIILTCSTENGAYRFNTEEIRRVLGPEVPLNHPEVSMWVKEDLDKGMKDIFGGVK
ncbi:MAG: ATP-binding protein [Christensenellales bacterium]